MPQPRRLNIKRQNKRYYRHVVYPQIKISEGDIYITSGVNQRLDLLAKQFYNDVDLWWVINIANPNLVPRDSFYIPPGVQIRIPTNINTIKDQFDEINNK